MGFKKQVAIVVLIGILLRLFLEYQNQDINYIWIIIVNASLETKIAFWFVMILFALVLLIIIIGERDMRLEKEEKENEKIKKIEFIEEID